MKNEELKKILETLPDCLDVEIAVKGRGGDEKYMRRIVVGVERRHDKNKGKDFISLICLKSLRAQYGQEKEKEAYVKGLLNKAGLLQKQKDEAEQIADKVERDKQKGLNFSGINFGDFGKATFAGSEAEQIAKPTESHTTRTPKQGKDTPKPRTMADLPQQIKESLQQRKAEPTGEGNAADD